MKKTYTLYKQNPLIHKDRRLSKSPSAWVRSFSCEDVKPLIVCRGPIRKEALDVFSEMGITHCGILLSDKDSIGYPHALAPELRQFTEHSRVHMVPDYTGATKQERVERIHQIIGMARDNGYNAIFAGYGFMSEDAEFVGEIEKAGLTFIGPCAATQERAGRKDEAKRTALSVGVSVTPGVDNLAARTLCHKYPTRADLLALAKNESLALACGENAIRSDVALLPGSARVPRAGLGVPPKPSESRKAPPQASGETPDAARETRALPGSQTDASITPEDLAEHILAAAGAKGVDLFSIDELGAQAQREVAALFKKYPNSRFRLKAIGGGGGKGQRIMGAELLHLPAGKATDAQIEQAAAEAPGLVREILSEVKAGGAGDNKNILIELNIEQTRHNEIQLLGNGKWCIALGGRDCSLQMHEQKLLEVSVTQEGLSAEIEKARAAAAGNAEIPLGGRREAPPNPPSGSERSEKPDNSAFPAGATPTPPSSPTSPSSITSPTSPAAKVAALENDLRILKRMEEEAERFGLAAGLDSVSTFECIVDRDRHFFMEVNTRIQVEHRVTELCYALKFTNPENPQEHFIVESLVEAMALVARHKERLPKPARAPRFGAAVEARLNAQNDALAPHAGGVIYYWSKPVEGEVRDDQGISLANPDTGHFMRYLVAGAYDSNIALLLTTGGDRRASYERLSEIIRNTTLRGNDLSTNMEFHYGLVNWFLGNKNDVMAKPTTRFVVPYLTLVGSLKEEAAKIDPTLAFYEMKKHYAKRMAVEYPDDPGVGEAMSTMLDRKATMMIRPMEKLLRDPHLLSGWLSTQFKYFRVDANGKVVWTRNPVGVLHETYEYLHMSYKPNKPAADVIWEHDNKMIQESRRFYKELRARLGIAREEYDKVTAALEKPEPQGGMDEQTWDAVRSAHLGYEAGLELLGILFLIGINKKFWDLRVEENLEITIPEYLTDPDLQARMKRVLAPPPATKADEIVAICGGMYYSQEAPDMPPFVTEGMHFEKGQALYIIEVMKMFNKVPAPFSGTIDKILMTSGEGTTVSKGQPLFKITPDEKFVAVDEQALEREKRETTLSYLRAVMRA